MAETIRLSKNFALSEMVKSATAERLNVEFGLQKSCTKRKGWWIKNKSTL